jgi:hypothetical protein
MNQTCNALIRTSYTYIRMSHCEALESFLNSYEPCNLGLLLFTRSTILAHFLIFPRIYLEKGRWNESSTFIPTSLFSLSWCVFTTSCCPYGSFLRPDTLKPNRSATLLPLSLALSLILFRIFPFFLAGIHQWWLLHIINTVPLLVLFLFLGYKIWTCSGLCQNSVM